MPEKMGRPKLRRLSLIGRRGPLKQQYLNQVEKKVREKTGSTLSAAPSVPREDPVERFFSCLICIAFTVAGELKRKIR